MALFAITYDLVKRKDYPELWDELDKMGAHKALLSFYLVSMNATGPHVVKARLKSHIDDDDRLMVVQITGKPSFTKALPGTNAWIEANCP